MAVFFWRRHPDSNRGIRVLQTRALPLGYIAEYIQFVLMNSYSITSKLLYYDSLRSLHTEFVTHFRSYNFMHTWLYRRILLRYDSIAHLEQVTGIGPVT